MPTNDLVTNVNRLRVLMMNCKASLAKQGVEVPNGTSISDYPDKIEAIQRGTGSNYFKALYEIKSFHEIEDEEVEV